MSIDRVSADAEGSGTNQVPDIGDQGLFAGAKIDSEEEALASAVPAETAISDAAADAETLGALYTLGMWRVHAGRQEEFIAAWKALGDIFRQLPQPPAGKGTLLQSVTDPAIFYSFGPWLTLADIEAMRLNAQVQAGLAALRQYCSEMQADAFRTVAEAEIVTRGQ
jgi:hypothetical protein